MEEAERKQKEAKVKKRHSFISVRSVGSDAGRSSSGSVVKDVVEIAPDGGAAKKVLNSRAPL